jgi:hypothetical protein
MSPLGLRIYKFRKPFSSHLSAHFVRTFLCLILPRWQYKTLWDISLCMLAEILHKNVLLNYIVINLQIWMLSTLKKEHIWQMYCAQTLYYTCCTESASFGVIFVKVLVYKVVTTWEHDNIAFYFVSCLHYICIFCTKNINWTRNRGVMLVQLWN